MVRFRNVPWYYPWKKKQCKIKQWFYISTKHKIGHDLVVDNSKKNKIKWFFYFVDHTFPCAKKSLGQHDYFITALVTITGKCQLLDIYQDVTTSNIAFLRTLKKIKKWKELDLSDIVQDGLWNGLGTYLSHIKHMLVTKTAVSFRKTAATYFRKESWRHKQYLSSQKTLQKLKGPTLFVTFW